MIPPPPPRRGVTPFARGGSTAGPRGAGIVSACPPDGSPRHPVPRQVRNRPETLDARAYIPSVSPAGGPASAHRCAHGCATITRQAGGREGRRDIEHVGGSDPHLP